MNDSLAQSTGQSVAGRSGNKNTAGVLDHIADLHQQIYTTLLSSLTENWMGIDYTMPQLKVLLCLYIDGTFRMGDLAGALAVSTPTATGIVDRLVRRGDIDRGHDTEDRRVVTCSLTPQGQENISALWLAKFEVFREIFGTLTPEELDVVAKAEEVVLKAATRMNTKAPMALALQSGGSSKR